MKTGVERRREAVYRYGGNYYEGAAALPLKGYRPAEGERITVKETPYFGGVPVALTGYGGKTVEELLAIAAQQATPAQIIGMIQEEQAARAAADGALGAEIGEARDIALGASVALVFSNKAELDAWMAASPPYPHDGYFPSDLRNGWKALMRDEDEPDYWRDGDAGVWRESEAKLDLSGYRRSAEQDALDALKAPLESPVFTGTPTVPDPLANGYEVPLQAAPVRDFLLMYDLVMDTAGKYVRAADETPEPRFRTLRTLDAVPGKRDEFRTVDSV